MSIRILYSVARTGSNSASSMGWTPKAQLQSAQQPNANQQSHQVADPNGITAFEAVERELGLKLVKQKRTIPVIVVDHVAEKPIE